MKEHIRVSLTSGTIIKFLVWTTVFIGLFYISDLIITLLVAVVLASSVEMPANALMRRGLSRGIAVSLIFIATIAAIVLVCFIFIPPIADDFARFIKTIPQILDSVRIFGRDLGFRDVSLFIQDLSRDISKGQILTVLKNTFFGTGGLFATTSALISGIVRIVIVFVLAFYLALEEKGVQKFLRLILPKIYEGYVENLWERAQTKIGLWMQGQLLLSLFVALLVYIPMLVLSIPYAALLAVLAFIGELIPLVGILLSFFPAIFLAYTQGGLTLLGIVVLIYFIIAQLENHVLYPRVMSKMVGVPSIIVIIAVIVGAKFAGIWGVILAVPLASVFMELASDLEKRKSNVVQ